VTYVEFLEAKRFTAPDVGVTVDPAALHSKMFDFQRALTAWALRKGRAAIFADTGLGKTLMQIEWLRAAGERPLILAPLAVAFQIVEEAREKWGIEATYAPDRESLPAEGIAVTNYERLGKFDPSVFDAVSLDESSILKGYASKTRKALTAAFAATPYRLCCTATPAPNDVIEITNHSEFLGVMSGRAVLSTFFVHVANKQYEHTGWRLKRHGRESFYKWMSTWAAYVKNPADLGFPGDEYVLPPLDVRPHVVETDFVPEGQLFATGVNGVSEQSAVRRGTMDKRVSLSVDLVMAEPDQQFIAWCGLNDEATAMARAIGADAVNVQGSDSPESKADALLAFARGDIRVLVTKPTIAGFGMNFQNCARQVFVGMNYSYEQYYQAIRRCWRYGQQSPVRVDVVVSDLEQDIYESVRRKELVAHETAENVIRHSRGYTAREITGGETVTETGTERETVSGESWDVHLGDSVEVLDELEPDSVGLSVFSPPFLSLFQYSQSARDVGNSQGVKQFLDHLGRITDGVYRALMPGRNICVHVQNVATTKTHDGVLGLYDLRGDFIRHYIDRGFIYHGEATIDKNPQVQAVRLKALGLLFITKNERDAALLRPGQADYLLIFKKPGENTTPVRCDVTDEEWIEWAHPSWKGYDAESEDVKTLEAPPGVWYDIRETDVLNSKEGKGKEDEKHICPLQLGLIRRCVRLWSNPGELVLDPFSGIGSTGYESIKVGRRYVGIELKPSYHRAAVKNMKRAEAQAGGDLFAWAAEREEVPA